MDTLDYFAEMVRCAAKKQGSFTVEGEDKGPATVKLEKNAGYTNYYCTCTHRAKGFKFEFGVMLKSHALASEQALYCMPEQEAHINSGLIKKSRVFTWKTERKTEEKWFTVQEPHNSDFFSDVTDDKKIDVLAQIFAELEQVLA
jgi:hypothetical protein